jgi:nitrite reductase (NADH) large subunit
MGRTTSGSRSRRIWIAAQGVSVLATLVLIAALALRPEPALRLLWKVLIPLVPAALLFSPLLWRNVCPLATLEMLAQKLVRNRPPARRWARAGAVAGIVLLAVMVPGRHLVFNTDGPVLAWTITAVAALAIGGGLAFDARGGFCNTVCPVLPVERLYGQSPLVDIGSPRCGRCTGCAPGCIDLGPRTAPFKAIGAAREGSDWTRTAFGSFAAAFPGFVLGYFTTADGLLSSAASMYAQVALLSGASWVLTTAIARTWKVGPEVALPVLGASAAGVYYAYAAPQLAVAVGLPEAGGVLRAAFLILIAFWWWQADRRRRDPNPADVRQTRLAAWLGSKG